MCLGKAHLEEEEEESERGKLLGRRQGRPEQGYNKEARVYPNHNKVC